VTKNHFPAALMSVWLHTYLAYTSDCNLTLTCIYRRRIEIYSGLIRATFPVIARLSCNLFAMPPIDLCGSGGWEEVVKSYSSGALSIYLFRHLQ